MEKGMCILIAGVFVGVFAGALAHELLKKTEIGQRVGKKISGGLRAAKRAFMEGYRPKAAARSAEATSDCWRRDSIRATSSSMGCFEPTRSVSCSSVVHRVA